MKPLLSAYLITSTPDSHQIAKRIKGLLAYSEHYKGNRVDYPIVGSKFSPLGTKDYHKARELTLEIWDPMVQLSFLEKFLKSQRNLQNIWIKVLTKREYKGEILKRLCQILSKISGLSRVHIDFPKELMDQVTPELTKRIRSMRKLPKLKEFDVTVEDQQVLPFSVSLAKVGFYEKSGSFVVKDLTTIQKLMKKTWKFHQLDTIKIESRRFFGLPDSLWEALVLVISKLPQFREFGFNYSKDLYFPLKQIVNLLDALIKAPKFEILRLKIPIKNLDQISLLKHPIFQLKSMKRIHLSLYFHSPNTAKDLASIFDILLTIPSLYELHLDFSKYTDISDEIIEALAKKLAEISGLQKLKILFAESSRNFRAGSLVRSIFSMNSLEELELNLPKNCLELGEYHDMHGLPRLKKVSIKMARWDSQWENQIKGMLVMLGRCQNLRELELSLDNSVYDYEGMARALIVNLKKLKELQVFKLFTSSNSRNSSLKIYLLEALVWTTLNGLTNLQDFSLWTGLDDQEYQHRLGILRQETRNDKKYRFVVLA